MITIIAIIIITILLLLLRLSLYYHYGCSEFKRRFHYFIPILNYYRRCFLKVKEMPKLFRFIAADFPSRDASVEMEESFDQKNYSSISLKTISW